MIGLIKKDLLIIKSNIRLVLVMFLVFFLMSWQGKFDMSFAPAFVSIMLFMSTFSYDEYNKWNAYAVTLPNGRKNVVMAKYVATLILVIISIFVTVLLNIVIGIINNNVCLEEVISTMSGCFLGIVIIEAIMYPLIFKYGIEKGRIGLFIGSFGIVGMIGLLSKVIKINIPGQVLNFINDYFIIMAFVLSIIALGISYKVAEKIYLKKEF